MLKHFLILLLLAIPLIQIRAQTKAVTETGDEVVLYDDGTWEFIQTQDTNAIEIPLNPVAFVKPEKSTFLVKSNKTKMGIWIDPKKWNFNKAESGEAAEFQFHLKDGDLYAMLISEKLEIPIETLREIAFENARSAAPDAKIEALEFRNVNGLQVLSIQMAGTIQGLKFRYYGYYYSYPGGTIQFLTYTSENLFEEYIDEIEPLLNGLVELK